MRSRFVQSRRRLIFPASLVLTLVWASQYSLNSPAGPDIEWFDKVAHFFVFGLLATLVYRSFDFSMKSTVRWCLGLLVVMLYSSIDETIQYFNPVRTADWMDLLADGLGACVALFVYQNWTFYRQLMERPLFGTKV